MKSLSLWWDSLPSFVQTFILAFCCIAGIALMVVGVVALGNLLFAVSSVLGWFYVGFVGCTTVAGWWTLLEEL